MSKVDAAAPVFAALGDSTRLSLLLRLSAGPSLSIAALASQSRLSRQAVTKHLRVLEIAGLVASHRTGRESRYAFDREGMVPASEYLDRVALQWDDALARLRSFVER